MSDTTPPIINDDGYESHPAFGLIGAHRVSNGPRGATLFDSDIQHHHTVVVRLHGAKRQRNLNRDWIGTDSRLPIVEVQMSEAQWASFVSSMNVGDGVPCTIRTRDSDHNIPELPYEPRMAESMAEVREAGNKVLAEIQAAFDAVEEKPSKTNIKTLKYAIQNATPNMIFAAESLTAHTEKTVQRARADIEAMTIAKARQLGLDPAELGVPQLGTGSEDTNV